MTPLVVENEPPVTFLRRKMTGGRFSMGVVIRRYTGKPTRANPRQYSLVQFQKSVKTGRHRHVGLQSPSALRKLYIYLQNNSGIVSR